MGCGAPPWCVAWTMTSPHAMLHCDDRGSGGLLGQITTARRAIRAVSRQLARQITRLRNRLAARRAGLLARPAHLSGTVPAALDIGETEVAERLGVGVVRFAGVRVDLGSRSPWAVQPAEPGWLAAMHGFEWLDHALVGRKAVRARLRGWLFDWLRRHGHGVGPGWTPELAGRRLARMACDAPALLRAADRAEARALRRSLRVHLAFLRARHRAPETLLHRVDAATGLVIGALAVEDARRSLALGQAALVRAARAVQADGGVPDRNPATLAGLFVRLAWTADALGHAGHVPDPEHTAALRRLGPALRALRLGDGGLPRFHGGTAAEPALDHAYALAGAAARGVRVSAAMGFERLSGGRTSVIVDAARPPAGAPLAAGSPLALEMSVGRHRVLGSVGPGHLLGGEWSVASRATAAHSAVEIAGVSSVRLMPDGRAARVFGRPLVDGPRIVSVEREEDLDGGWLLGEHDGYLERFGLVVVRRLHLSRDGCDFRGEDTVTAPDAAARRMFDRVARRGGIDLCIRFHLAAGVEAETLRGQRGVGLRLPDGSHWVMRSSGGVLTLADSIWIDEVARRAVPSRQIVIAARAEGYFGRVTWALHRADRTADALREAVSRSLT